VGADWWLDASAADNFGAARAKWRVSIEAYCESDNGPWRLRGEIVLKQRIGIQPGRSKQQQAETYGHEQRHVRNMISAANEIIDDLNRRIVNREWPDLLSAGKEARIFQQLAEMGLQGPSFSRAQSGRGL
jgi:hypothetical protein